MELLQSTDFWIGLLKIVWINIILSGDNAVVIAMAARTLPPHQQGKAVFWGSGAAVALRILLTVVAAKLLANTPLLTGQRVLDALFPSVLVGMHPMPVVVLPHF